MFVREWVSLNGIAVGGGGGGEGEMRNVKVTTVVTPSLVTQKVIQTFLTSHATPSVMWHTS
jgi:hypothetical protein